MDIHKKILLPLLILFSIAVSAQYVQPMRYFHYSFPNQVNIGNGSIKITDPSAYLEIGPSSGGNKGILFPRLTTTNRNAIASPANGLFIYNTTSQRLNYFQNEWRDIPGWMDVFDSVYKRNDSIFYSVGSTEHYAFKSIDYPDAGIVRSTGSAWGTSIADNSTNWNTAYGWGDHSIAGYVSGTGTTDYIPRWTSANTIGNSSLLYDNGTNAGSTARFLAPSMGSPATSNYYSFFIDGNGGLGPIFSNGYIQNLNLGGYHYTMDVRSADGGGMGYYTGAYVSGTHNAYIIFKPVGNRIMFNTLTDSTYKFTFAGSSFKFTGDSLWAKNIKATSTPSDSGAVINRTTGLLEMAPINGTGGADGYVDGGSFDADNNILTITQDGADDVNIQMQGSYIRNPAHPDSLVRKENDSTLIVKAVSVSSANSKLTINTTRTDSTINHEITVNEANMVIPQSSVTNLTTDLAAKAPIASPTFTGVPAAPTASAGTNTTQIATTEFVKTAVDDNNSLIKSTSSVSSDATPDPVGSSWFNYFTITAQAATATFSAPSGTPANGNSLLIRITATGGEQTLNWNAIYRGGTDIALPTTTDLTMYIQFVYNSTDATWDLVGLTKGISTP